MDKLTLPQAKLLLFASRLPPFEKAILKELILEGNQEIHTAVEKYKSEPNPELFKNSVLLVVIGRSIDQAHEWWQHIFQDCSTNEAKKLAKAGKARLQESQANQPSLVYGEIDFFSFATLLEKAHPKPGATFVDIGHGTGRCLVATALLQGHMFSKIQGIELLQDLNDASQEMIKNYKKLEEEEQGFFGRQKRAEVVAMQGDLTDLSVFDWTQADIVFANSTCFDCNLMNTLSTLGEKMRPGSVFITLTKKLNSDEFDLVERKQYAMSWGPATCFIHMRKQSSPV